MLMQKFSRGFSVIEVLVAAFISAIISLAVASTIYNQQKSMARIYDKSNLIELKANLMIALQKTSVCSFNLTNVPTNIATKNFSQSSLPTTAIELYKINDGVTPSSNIMVEKNAKIPGSNSAQVDKMELKNFFKVDNSNFKADLVITVSSPNGPLAPITINGISLNTTGTDPNEVIFTCQLNNIGPGALTCSSSTRYDYPENTGTSATYQHRCDSPSAVITDCSALVYPGGLTNCGTNVLIDADGKPYCTTHGCTPPGPGQFWGISLTCCESNAPATTTDSGYIPNIGAILTRDCALRSPDTVQKIACGISAVARCNDDEVGLSGGASYGSNMALQNSSAVMTGTTMTGWQTTWLDTNSCQINVIADGTTAPGTSPCFDHPSFGGFPKCGSSSIYCCKK